MEKVKIKEVDNEKISATLIVLKPNVGWTYHDRVIMFSEIKELKKRKFSLVKTTGLVALLISITIIIATIHVNKFGLAQPGLH